jgi:hypothetical protein
MRDIEDQVFAGSDINITKSKVEECDTVFDSQQGLIQHKIYARYRRPGICWQ